MKRIFALFFILTLMVSSLSIAQVMGESGWRVGEKQIRISNPEHITQLRNLKINLDFYPPAYDHITAYVTPEELKQIESLGIPYTVEIEDLNSYYKDYWMLLDAYHSYQQIIELADSLAGAFPSICKKVLYGYSVQNRQLAALKISDNVNIDENEPEIMFDGGIHGDEIGGPENIIRFARDLCVNYGTDPTITNLINTREIWLWLMVNPDGRYNMSRYNGNGVDLNRDWGYMWDEWGGSPAAFSQVETKTLRDFMYDNQFVVYTSYHSGTEIISYPWSYRPNACPDQSHINQLAQTYSTVSGYSYLEYGQGYNVMYAINGSTKDGGYAVMGSVSWSIEISNSKQPPASQIMQYYNWNYPSMVAMIENSGYGLSGTVTDSVSGDPVAGIIFVNNYYPCYADPAVGDYHKYVLPGTYSITVKANGYRTKTINNVVVTANNSTVTDFQLAPQTGQYVYKFSSSQIPNNNYSDEGLTSAAIGEPDNINYSIGKNGWCVLDMQYPIVDGPGPDFIVHEGDATPEGFYCYVGQSIDGPWLSLGSGNGTTGFDIAGSGLLETQYIKILDDNDGTANSPDAGFDLDAIEALEPVSGIYLAMSEYHVDDTNGNNNGKIDPGETVDIIVTLINNGDVTAQNIEGVISSISTYLTLVSDTAGFGTLAQGQSAQGTYTVTADPNTPNGEQVVVNLDVSSNNGAYTNNFVMNFVVGQVPVLIVDLDPNQSSGTALQTAAQEIEVSTEYTTALPADLNLYTSVFVCLGIYSNNHVLTSSEGQALADYLTNGGRLYMEGGDTWYYDAQTAVHPMFNIQGVSDGSGDLGTILGQNGYFTEGMSFSYSGENSYIDHINPISPAFTIFVNQSPSYNCAVAYDETTYKTVGASFEFGGLNDGSTPSTKAKLLTEILNFFDVVVPVELVSLSANVDEKYVTLSWITATETNNMGFDVERCEKLDINAQTNWYKLAFIEGKGTTTEITHYSFMDGIEKPGNYLYRLKQIDFDGSFTYSQTVEVSISSPTDFALYQNYPNPFNPSTTIKFGLPKTANVELSVYNSLGEKVSDVFIGELKEGYHEIEFRANSLASGIYFYRLKSDRFISIKKMVLMK